MIKISAVATSCLDKAFMNLKILLHVFTFALRNFLKIMAQSLIKYSHLESIQNIKIELIRSKFCF